MNPTRLRLALFALIATLQLSAMVIIVSSAHDNLQRQRVSFRETLLLEVSDTVTEQINQFLQPVQTQLTGAHRLIDNGFLRTDDDLQLERFFRAQLETNPWLRGMFIGRADGSFIATTQDGRFERVRTRIVFRIDESQVIRQSLENTVNGHRATWTSPDNGYDPRRRIWYLNAIGTEQATWTDAFTSYPAGIPMIVAAVNVSSSSLPGTVLGMSIDLRQLTHYISRASVPESVTVSIIDGDHHVIAASNQVYFTQVLEQSGLPKIEDLVSPEIVRLYELQQEHNRRHLLTLKHADTPVPVSDPAVPTPSAENGGTSSDAHPGVLAHEQAAAQGSSTLYSRTEPLQLFDNAIQWTLIVTLPDSVVAATRWYSALPALITQFTLILTAGFAAGCLLIRLTQPVFQLHHDATVDHLTGALNRGEFLRRCVAWSASQHTTEEISSQMIVAVIDLDGFKIINDRFGHDAGDAILRAAVERLTAELPESSLIGRLGGDEFAIAFSIAKHTDNLAQMERIRTRTVTRPVRTRTGIHRFGMTVGFARCTDGESLLNAINRADSALITGKTIRKNTCYGANSTMSPYQYLASFSERVTLAAS